MVRGESSGVSPPREVLDRPRVLELTFEVLRELDLLRYSVILSAAA